MNYQNCHKTKSNLNRKSNKTKKKFNQIKKRVLARCQKLRTKVKQRIFYFSLYDARLLATFELPHFNCSLYDARVLATLGKIIVVTFNYRIGVLGKNELR